MGPSYWVILGTHGHNAISHKAEKEGKPHGKNPPPKREINKDVLMDGVIRTPPIRTYTQYIHKRIRKGREIE